MQTPPFGVPAGKPRAATYERLRNDVAARLRMVCAAWSEEDFQAVVEKVTQTALKYIELDAAARGESPGRPDEHENQS